MKLSILAVALLSLIAVSGQTPAPKKALAVVPASWDPKVRALIDELVLANHMLTEEGVLDAYGHVSVRSPSNPNHFFLARHIPAGTVTADDIIEYDLDSKPVVPTKFVGYTQRFIHGEIYKLRPDVHSVVHGHAAEIVAFSVTSTPLKPIAHMAAFLGDGAPVFEIRTASQVGDMLIRTPELGHALAQALGEKPAILMRGHGAVVVAESLHVVAGRSYYMNLNARELQQALILGAGKVTYLTPEEVKQSAAQDGFERAWEAGKARLTGQKK